jgi:hypothetical protein
LYLNFQPSIFYCFLNFPSAHFMTINFHLTLHDMDINDSCNINSRHAHSFSLKKTPLKAAMAHRCLLPPLPLEIYCADCYTIIYSEIIKSFVLSLVLPVRVFNLNCDNFFMLLYAVVVETLTWTVFYIIIFCVLLKLCVAFYVTTTAWMPFRKKIKYLGGKF